MLIVGLTGGIGSGKTTVANLFANLGVPIIDADNIARDLTNQDPEIITAIRAHFPEVTLEDPNKIDRAALRKLIFNQPQAKKWLENLLHPKIRNIIEQKIPSYFDSPYLIVVIPLLFEVNPYPFLQRVLVIDTPEHLQVARVQQRDGSEEELIKKIMASQLPRQLRREKADDVIVNDQGIANLEVAVNALHRKYLALSKMA